MIFFKSRYSRHFCGATFEFSQHCRESGVSLRKSDVFYRAAGDPGLQTFPHYRKSSVFCRKSDAFYRAAGDPLGPIQAKGKGQDWSQPLIWLVRVSRFTVQLFADRGRDGESAQVANLPRCPIRPHDQSAQTANPPDG